MRATIGIWERSPKYLKLGFVWGILHSIYGGAIGGLGLKTVMVSFYGLGDSRRRARYVIYK